MMTRQKKNPSLLEYCCSQPILQPTHIPTTKNDKISLRRLKSKPFQRHIYKSPPASPSPLRIRQYVCLNQSNTLKFKPKVTFQWHSPEVNRINKMQQSIAQLSPQIINSVQTTQTNTQNPLKKLQPKASLLSIKSQGSKQGSKREPKLEESLVVLDFFHPTKTQLGSIQKYLDRGVQKSLFLSPSK